MWFRTTATLNPNPPNPKPYTPNPKTQIQNPECLLSGRSSVPQFRVRAFLKHVPLSARLILRCGSGFTGVLFRKLVYVVVFPCNGVANGRENASAMETGEYRDFK